MTTVDGFKLLADAQDYLLTAVRGVPADAWGARTPCTRWTAGQGRDPQWTPTAK